MAVEERLTTEFVVRCDKCGMRAADGAEYREEAIRHAKAEGFKITSDWNGAAHIIRAICPFCLEDEGGCDG